MIFHYKYKLYLSLNHKLNKYYSILNKRLSYRYMLIF